MIGTSGCILLQPRSWSSLSIVIGFLMVVVFRYTSDQKAIRTRKINSKRICWQCDFFRIKFVL